MPTISAVTLGGLGGMAAFVRSDSENKIGQSSEKKEDIRKTLIPFSK